jgi:hypothetical protein
VRVAADERDAVRRIARHTGLPRAIAAVGYRCSSAGVDTSGQHEPTHASKGVLRIVAMHIHRMSRSRHSQKTEAKPHEVDEGAHA